MPRVIFLLSLPENIISFYASVVEICIGIRGQRVVGLGIMVVTGFFCELS